MNSMTSNCGSRSRAAQPVRRTPTTSGIRISIGFNLLGSTSNRLDAWPVKVDALRNAALGGKACGGFGARERVPGTIRRKGGVFRGTCRAPRCPMQQRTRAPHIPAGAAPASCRQPQEAGAAKLPRRSRASLRRCVMSQDRTSVSKEVLGSLTSCLMEGNAEEEKGARKSRRRALIVSIVVQILVLATLVLYPLLSHGARLAATVFTPVPPYTYSGGPARPIGNNTQPAK